MPIKKSDECHGLGLAKNFYKTYNQTKLDNPVTTGNKKVDRALLNPVTGAIPVVGWGVKAVGAYNKVYQAGGHVARIKGIYDSCKKK